MRCGVSRDDRVDKFDRDGDTDGSDSGGDSGDGSRPSGEGGGSNAHINNNEAGNADHDYGRAKHGEDGGPSDEDPSESDSSAGDMDLSVQIPVPESAMGSLIRARGTMLGTIADLTGCRNIVAKERVGILIARWSCCAVHDGGQ